MKFRKKTVFDLIEDGNLDDAALARRMKVWISSKKTSVARRAISLYDKQTDEERAVFSKHGISEIFVEKHRKRIARS